MANGQLNVILMTYKKHCTKSSKQSKFSLQQISKQAQRFARQLEGRFGLPAVMVDERLTTREAWQIVVDCPDRKSKTDIDNLSAVLITESWLRDYNPPDC